MASPKMFSLEIFEEIRAAADKIVEAYNSGEFNISEFYTKDCVIALPGQESLNGHKGTFSVRLMGYFLQKWL